MRRGCGPVRAVIALAVAAAAVLIIYRLARSGGDAPATAEAGAGSRVHENGIEQVGVGGDEARTRGKMTRGSRVGAGNPSPTRNPHPRVRTFLSPPPPPPDREWSAEQQAA